MRCLIQTETISLLRFDRGEEVIEKLLAFATETSLSAGVFTGLGAAGAVTLSYYNLSEKKYEDHELHEELEIASLSGNLALLNDKPLIHAHGVFSNQALATRGGHVKKLIVSATCEITVTKLDGILERQFDDETGLNLLQ